MITARLEIFPEHVDSIRHPTVQQFRQMLLNIAETYRRSLDCFTEARAMVTFAFADEQVTNDMLDSLWGMISGIFKKIDRSVEQPTGGVI